MTAYALRRILGLIPVLIGISLLVFAIPRTIRGDPATIILGERASPESLARLRQQLGLNEPYFFNIESMQERGAVGLFDSQYFNFVGGLLRGDMGRSIHNFVDVRRALFVRFPATFELAVAAMLFAVIIGIPVGVLAALNRGNLIDTGLMFLALAGVSFPVFWLGIIMIYTFAVNLGWFPPSGRLAVGLDLNIITGFYIFDSLIQGRFDVTRDALRHIVMPSIALGTIPLATVVRMTRSSMLEVLNQDYVRTAKAKGLGWQKVINKHAFRNALLPVVTVLGLSFGLLLSGAILTESVFDWPGIGLWVYDAISSRDYPIIQGGVLFVAFVFVLVNLIVDLSYAFIDPRIQYS